MPAATRVLLPPGRLSGRFTADEAALAVTADALARRAAAEGRDLAWYPAVLAGDSASQWAVERELVRAGHDRDTLGRDGLLAKVAEHQAASQARAVVELEALGIGVPDGAAITIGPRFDRAARTAFVRLYEQGALLRDRRPVTGCPRCATVVGRDEVVTSSVEGEALTIAVDLDTGDQLPVTTGTPELLAGVALVAVPAGHPAAGSEASVPFAGSVPVVADHAVDEPWFVVPAHDPEAVRFTVEMSAPAMTVLDDDGIVRVPGPLDGLGRFAARSAAAKLLHDDGVLLGRTPTVASVDRCRLCGTTLVTRLGLHWFLATPAMEVAAADALRALVDVHPAIARDTFVEQAGSASEWCVSRQLWAGVPVPAATCSDCGRVDVSVEEQTACRRCMGLLQPDDEVLDARFVGALWPLVVEGWPDDGGPVSDGASVLLVHEPGVARWAVPMAALGLRLSGSVPFSSLVVARLPQAGTLDLDAFEVVPLVEEWGRATVRVALLHGLLDLAAAARIVALVADPPEGDADVDALAEACAAAYRRGDPSLALDAIAAAVATGVRPSAVERVRALAAPLLGE